MGIEIRLDLNYGETWGTIIKRAFGNLKIGRDGIEHIIDTISNTPAIRMVEKITKSGAGILVSLIRDIM